MTLALFAIGWTLTAGVLIDRWDARQWARVKGEQ